MMIGRTNQDLCLLSGRVVLSALVCLVLLGGGWGIYQFMIKHPVKATETPSVEVIPAVEVVQATVADERVVLESQGRVRAAERSILTAEVAGVVVQVASDFREGRIFRKGEVMVAVEMADYQNALDQAEAALVEARTALCLEEARAEQAQSDWSRLGGEREASDLTLRKPQLAAAQARVMAAEAQRAMAARDLEKTRVRAPYDCRIERTSVELGSYLVPGQPVVELYALRDRELTVALGLTEYALLQREQGQVLGDGVGYLMMGSKQLEWPVKIVRATGRIGEATSAGEVLLEALPNEEIEADEFITPPPGAFLRVALQGRILDQTISLPRRALRADGSVLVVVDSCLQERQVEILRSDPERVLVGEGLKGGEQVVVSELEVPIIGMPVKISTEVSKN